VSSDRPLAPTVVGAATTTSSPAVFRGPASDPVTFAVVDVETSGLSPRRHRVLQIGVVTVDAAGTVLERWSTHVRPRRWWPRVGPTRIHGIRRRDLRGAPDTRSAIDELQRRIAGAVVVAHNATFDLAFLTAAASRAGASLHVDASLCTLDASRRLDPERSRPHRLGALCERYGVTLMRPHDALADADATAALLPHLLADHGIHLDQVRADGRSAAATLRSALIEAGLVTPAR
jgi:DNA polymerase-3 subunit epsilon